MKFYLSLHFWQIVVFNWVGNDKLIDRRLQLHQDYPTPRREETPVRPDLADQERYRESRFPLAEYETAYEREDELGVRTSWRR